MIGDTFVETSAGRILFNRALPEGYPFVNRTLNQTDLRNIEAEILERYGEDRTVEYLDTIKTQGFHYATLSGVSWGMDDLKIPANKPAIIRGVSDMSFRYLIMPMNR